MTGVGLVGSLVTVLESVLSLVQSVLALVGGSVCKVLCLIVRSRCMLEQIGLLSVVSLVLVRLKVCSVFVILLNSVRCLLFTDSRNLVLPSPSLAELANLCCVRCVIVLLSVCACLLMLSILLCRSWPMFLPVAIWCLTVACVVLVVCNVVCRLLTLVCRVMTVVDLSVVCLWVPLTVSYVVVVRVSMMSVMVSYPYYRWWLGWVLRLKGALGLATEGLI